MAQDIRELMKGKPSNGPSLPQGHEARFEARLQAAFGDEKQISGGKKPMVFWMQVAAVAIAFLAVSFFGYNALTKNNEDNTIVENNPTIEGLLNEDGTQKQEKMIRLGDISPEIKRAENLLTAGINVQLASLEITNDNKDVIDGYMKQLDGLKKEYEQLNLELNELGPNEETITALFDNLKMQLELVLKLNNKLKELKNQKDEQISSIEV